MTVSLPVNDIQKGAKKQTLTVLQDRVLVESLESKVQSQMPLLYQIEAFHQVTQKTKPHLFYQTGFDYLCLTSIGVKYKNDSRL